MDRKKHIPQFDLLMSCSAEQTQVLNQVLLFLGPGACLVESESGRNTSAVGGPNVDGSYDYGLFQINNRYWCGNASRGGGCHLRCSELLTDDIAQAVGCAKLIYRLQGFSAWHGWTKKCKNRHIPDVIHCLNETSTRDPPVYSVIMN